MLVMVVVMFMVVFVPIVLVMVGGVRRPRAQTKCRTTNQQRTSQQQ